MICFTYYITSLISILDVILYKQEELKCIVVEWHLYLVLGSLSPKRNNKSYELLCFPLHAVKVAMIIEAINSINRVMFGSAFTWVCLSFKELLSCLNFQLYGPWQILAICISNWWLGPYSCDTLQHTAHIFVG